MFINFEEDELDKEVYRIISLQRLEELLSTSRNGLVKPHKWEDPFENFILRSKVRMPKGDIVEYNYHNWLYGQCWSFNKESDAMWRIYSPESGGIRVRTTVRKLAESLFISQQPMHEVKCAIGKVEYLNQTKLTDYANNIFDDYGIAVESLFKSLLAKRSAFKHENEVRLLYCSLDDEETTNDLFYYDIDPHSLITQIMIDPRMSPKEADDIKKYIRKKTSFRGEIKRSLLYSFKNDMIIDAKKIDIATGKKITTNG